MKVLCDTHALAWWLLDDPHLSSKVRALIIDPRTEVWVSAVSAFEMATKHRLGKWPGIGDLVTDFEIVMTQENFAILPLSAAHAKRGGLFDGPHRDPFDRLLAAQSIIEGIPLATSDGAFTSFGVETVW